MDLPRTLLDVARALARMDTRGRPRQAALRRAVSTAYYAMFHLLTGAAAERMFPNAPERERYGPLAKRAFTHTEVKKLAEAVARPAGKRGKLDQVLLSDPLEPDLAAVAATFVQTLDRRDEADYDVSIRIGRSATLTLIDRVEDAFHAWDRAESTDDGQRFLIAMLLYARGRN